METGTALVRAMIKIMDMHKTQAIQVINMSYGEHAHWSNAGYWLQNRLVLIILLFL